jgi:hypothetical protein
MSTRALISWTLAVALTAGSAVLSADRVKLRKDGRVIEGNFVSADAKRVRLLLANGSIAEFPIEDITAVEFSAKAPPPPAPDPHAPLPCDGAGGYHPQRPARRGD